MDYKKIIIPYICPVFYKAAYKPPYIAAENVTLPQCCRPPPPNVIEICLQMHVIEIEELQCASVFLHIFSLRLPVSFILLVYHLQTKSGNFNCKDKW